MYNDAEAQNIGQLISSGAKKSRGTAVIHYRYYEDLNINWSMPMIPKEENDPLRSQHLNTNVLNIC
jgi:hypothetical protein